MNKNKQVSHSKQETISIIFTHPWVSVKLGTGSEHLRNIPSTPQDTPEHPSYGPDPPGTPLITKAKKYKTENWKTEIGLDQAPGQIGQ